MFFENSLVLLVCTRENCKHLFFFFFFWDQMLSYGNTTVITSPMYAVSYSLRANLCLRTDPWLLLQLLNYILILEFILIFALKENIICSPNLFTNSDFEPLSWSLNISGRNLMVLLAVWACCSREILTEQQGIRMVHAHFFLSPFYLILIWR